MCRKAIGVLAGWLTLASAAWGQTNQPTGQPRPQLKSTSPYGAANPGSMMWTSAPTDMPMEMPSIVIPSGVAGRTTSTQQQPPPPATPPAPSAPAGAATAPVLNGMGGCGQPSCTGGCGTCNSCNSCCDPCGPNGPCGPQGRVWGGIEYLLWTTRGMNVPVLVTASPVGTPREFAGALGDPRTSILYGGGTVNDDFRSGVRAYSGTWLDDCQTCGIESSIFYLEPANDSAGFICLSNGMIIARPFVDVNPANVRSNSELVCFPNSIAGGVFVNTHTTFWGSDVNARKNIWCGCDFRLDALGGYRFLQLQDQVQINENLIAVAPAGASPAGTGFSVFDSFYSKNTFNGGQLGLAGEWRRNRFFVSARGLVVLGSVHKEIEIAGSTVSIIPGQLPQTSTGGLLTQQSNIGKYTFNEFAVVPETTVSIGYNLTDGIRAFVGYTFLYLSNVSRAGSQIDTVVNSSQLPPSNLTGAVRPAFIRNDSDFWAQGINFGLEIRF